MPIERQDSKTQPFFIEKYETKDQPKNSQVSLVQNLKERESTTSVVPWTAVFSITAQIPPCNLLAKMVPWELAERILYYLTILSQTLPLPTKLLSSTFMHGPMSWFWSHEFYKPIRRLERYHVISSTVNSSTVISSTVNSSTGQLVYCKFYIGKS